MSISPRVMACYVNFILLLVAVALSYVSGLVLWLILPHGQARGGLPTNNTFLGLSRSAWENAHVVTSLSFLVLTIIHLMLNWMWIRNVTKCLLIPPSRKQHGNYRLRE
ncbi:MAG: DUF4405 domain-containing protein [Zestosphaera sp.]